MPGRTWARWAAIGLGACLALAAVAPRAARAQSGGGHSDVPGTRSKLIYYKNRAFRIPVTIPTDADGLVREVRLWVSDDLGYHWKEAGRTTPDRPEFPFRATRDGEYWFAIQTVDTQGKIYPSDDGETQPSLRVVVDTAPPTLVLEKYGRRGSQVGVRWEMADQNILVRSLTLEYQPEGAGAREWRSVPLRDAEFKLSGMKVWESGTSEALRVRATVSDRAKNARQVEILIDDGIAAPPGAVAGRGAEIDLPPPVSPISSRSGLRDGPFEDHEGFEDAANSGRARGFDDSGFESSRSVAGFESGYASSTRAPAHDGLGSPDQTLLVGSTRFPLQYQVEGSGPGGIAKVQLWVTHDAGRTWYPQPEDADKQSPYLVDLNGEGTFGLWLAVQGVSGLGDPPPAPGDRPQMWAEVDITPPVVQVDPPRVGGGRSAGQILITWRASDPHLGSRPVTISYRSETGEGDWVRMAGPIENTGKYVWVIPPGVPPRFRVKVEVVDTLGHVGAAESAPVLVDRTRPKGRIIGLDPSARFQTDETRR